MRTIFIGECLPGSLYCMDDPDEPNENQFTETVIKALSCIYSNYYCIVFNGCFLYEQRAYRPDLALIAKDYSHWFVIEVELASHSFEGHILPQVKAFRYGEPQASCSRALASQLGISFEQAQTLTLYVPCVTTVVVNRRKLDWEKVLASHNIQMLTVTSFRSITNIQALEIEGVLQVIRENLGFGTFMATDRSIRFPTVTRIPEGKLQIYNSEGVLSWWVIEKTSSAIWLRKESGVPDLVDGSYVQLIRTIEGRFSLLVHL
ncbi:hypothetical protein [Gloeobacter kilaueensis]|uniref:Uncharacterized protein n=1 Tax=Gloeobacter kilaueensis (strain ATCC BAA-2537 / CCAP 1431/1 / ULC 316 / JS1) TaxID=1183438 RepID=U5QSL4_GLOK1|nr:hypothetical protein [Gloeobacter kilaueensis]AGY60725.1 hypothetical protein GKIL_4479 [Gloeobacter kilaueensis JS1]